MLPRSSIDRLQANQRNAVLDSDVMQFKVECAALGPEDGRTCNNSSVLTVQFGSISPVHDSQR